jgi:hypothetical protein
VRQREFPIDVRNKGDEVCCMDIGIKNPEVIALTMYLPDFLRS